MVELLMLPLEWQLDCEPVCNLLVMCSSHSARTLPHWGEVEGEANKAPAALTSRKPPFYCAIDRSTPSMHIVELEPSGQGHRTRNTTHRAGTLVNRSKWQKTPNTKHNTPSMHTGERGQVANDTAHTAHRTCTPVNRSQVAKDITHTTQPPSGHTGGQEASSQGHRTHNTTQTELA